MFCDGCVEYTDLSRLNGNYRLGGVESGVDNEAEGG